MGNQTTSLFAKLWIHPVTMLFTLLNLALVIGLGYLVVKFLVSGIRFFNSQGRDTPQKQVIRRSLGETIKALRTEKGMTQEFVAQQLGVSRQAVSKWESGTSEPSTSNLLALAKLYGISPRRLLEQIEQ